MSVEKPTERQIEDTAEKKDTQLTQVPRKRLLVYNNFEKKMVTGQEWDSPALAGEKEQKNDCQCKVVSRTLEELLSRGF